MKKGKKIIVLLIAMIISIINIGVVKADTKNIEVTNVTVKDKSGTITVVDPVLSSNEITSNITFNKVDDFVTFELKIKNNESEKYKIESITDNNTNENISIDYFYDENFISKGETSTITIKLKYNKQLLNVEKVNLNDLTIKINFENEEGNSSEVVINPVTGDNILHYLVLLIISITGLIIIIKKKKKIGSILLVLPILLIPFITFAKEKYEVKIKFTDIEIKGEFETYNIIIDPKNGETPVTKAITYGNSIGELSESPSKEGYTFDKWVDSDGNTVTEDTVITGPIEIEAKYKVKEYTITYNLDGGTVTGNPEKYTIESEDITLKNPSKEGYTFSGWTGTGIDTKTTSVTIENGSTGNRSYTANYSANEDTEYKVTHRYQNLDGTYIEEEVTEYGETDKEVEAPIKSKTGFVNPSVQRVTITSDGSASVTYTYVRETYAFSITDRTYIDNTSTADGTYKYETPITIKAVERAGYDFSWSDGETALERTFNITEPISLTPVYTSKTNIPYKIVHQKQKITLDGYEIADTQNLTGTTDTSVTPAVNTYEGFTSPQTQTVTIKGDGSTVVTYNYDRIMYDFSTNNNEDVTSTKIDGRYPYGTEITLTAKEKQGYTFSKWSNDETSNPYTFILNSNLTIKPVYTSDGYTVTLNANGGSVNPTSITVNVGDAVGELPEPTPPTNKVFDGWYTELSEGTKVNAPYTPEGDITLYAHWNNNSFPEVFSEPGECTFNGSSGVLTGDNCSYANGTNKYIDTGINLYNHENHDKDYEIGFTIVSTNLSEQVRQATFMNTKLEGNNYPGLVFRRKTTTNDLDLSSRVTSSTNIQLFFDNTTTENVKIYRITNKETGIQEIFYSINDEEKVLVNDLSQFNPTFDLSVWFGASPADISATSAQRILKGTLKDMYIKLGTYQEDSNNYKITFNANGGSVTPASRKIDIGNEIGTLPIPTPPTGKEFIGWYTGLTDGEEVTSSYKPNSNKTIYARYTNISYIVSFNTNDGSTVASQTVNIGGKATRPTTNPTKNNYTFDNWYTDTSYNTLFDFENTIITKNTTIYAHFNDDQFPLVFNEPGECTFNGESGVITGEDCSFANGVNKYIDTGINLYNSTNKSKDYEIGFTIVNYNYVNQVSQATFMNSKQEASGYPGVVFRRKDIEAGYDLSSRNTSSQNARALFNYSDGIEKVKIYRITNEETGIQEIFYSINDSEKVLLNDLSQFNPTFDLSVWFGAAPTNSNATSAQRYLIGTMKDMYIKLGTYPEESDTDTYKITFNANGGSVTPSSKKINIGDEIGTLPTPTPPTGKTFDNWYTGLTDGVEVTSTYVPNTDIEIYARYNNSTYTVSFDTDGGSTVASQTVNHGGVATRPTTDPTKTGYTFDDWYTDDTYTTKFDFDTPITSDTTIYAHFEELKVCADNENITTLSSTTCSNNENITIGDGIVCKRAVKLHEETCSQTDGTYYCSGAGYTESGSKGTSTITYGSCGTSGTLSSGDAFTCDVNGDGDFDELTERFYYVSDYYDTSAKEFDDSTAVLIYYNNVTSGVSCNKNTFAYSTQADIQIVDPSGIGYNNYHGPLTVMKQLPTTSQWSNVSLKSDKRAILGEYRSTHDSPTTDGGTLPTDFSYEGYAARLLTAKELMAGCNLTEVGRYTTGELDSCNYIMENTKYAKSSIGSYGGWLETPNASESVRVWYVRGNYRIAYSTHAYDASGNGARPAIEVLKSKISY